MSDNFACAATPAPACASSTPVDVLIVGAGPVGLFAAFQAQVLGLSCRIIDTLPVPGGQCAELYPDKPIFDIPAVPVCTGQELTQRLLDQIAPFAVPMSLGDEAVALAPQAIDEASGWRITTRGGAQFDARAVLIAAGGGAFVPQRLAVEGAEALEGSQVHYAVRRLEDFAGQRVVVAGGGDSALDWALALRKRAAQITVLHRRAVFRAAPETVRRLDQAREAGDITVRVGTIAGLRRDAEGRLHGLDLNGPQGAETLDGIDHVVALFGLVAQLGALGEWGLAIEANRLRVDTCHYETSLPGVYAAGDIAGYPNKQKLILSGFHEASLALRHAYTRIHPARARTAVHSSNDRRLAAAILPANPSEVGLQS